MSHNISLTNILIDDIPLLRTIVGQLAKDKAKVDMDVTTFRTYQGQPNACNGAILISEGPHDIGLIRQPKGGYTLLFDPYRMSNVFHHPQASGGGYSYTNIGKLLQEYVLCKSEYTAAQNGLTTVRKAGVSGEVLLEITG